MILRAHLTQFFFDWVLKSLGGQLLNLLDEAISRLWRERVATASKGRTWRLLLLRVRGRGWTGAPLVKGLSLFWILVTFRFLARIMAFFSLQKRLFLRLSLSPQIKKVGDESDPVVEVPSASLFLHGIPEAQHSLLLSLRLRQCQRFVHAMSWSRETLRCSHLGFLHSFLTKLANLTFKVIDDEKVKELEADIVDLQDLKFELGWTVAVIAWIDSRHQVRERREKLNAQLAKLRPRIEALRVKFAGLELVEKELEAELVALGNLLQSSLRHDIF